MASKFESTEATNLVNGFCKALAGGKTKAEFKATISDSGADVSGDDEWDKIVDLADMMAAGVIDYIASLEAEIDVDEGDGTRYRSVTGPLSGDDTADADEIDLTV